MTAGGGSQGALKVAVFASGDGGNLKATMRLAGRMPQIARVEAVVSDQPTCRAVAIARAAGIPVIAEDFRAQCGRASECRTDADRRAYARRAESFHDQLDERLLDLERGRGPIDLVVLSYGRWIQGRLLERFAGRMINQHPGDLTLLDPDGSRALVGNDPVMKALRRRLPAVRTSTFFVDAGQDSGPIICQGPALDTAGIDATRLEARRLELLQKRTSDWPSLICALTLIAERALSIDSDRQLADGSSTISICGVPMRLGGLQLMADLETADPRLRPICLTVRNAIHLCAWEQPDP